MHIKKIEIKNVRSLSHVIMTFAQPAGWHVVIGDNGFGKSSLLRAIAMAMIGEKNVILLDLNALSWVQKNQKKGSILLQMERDLKDDGAHTQPIRREFKLNTKMTIRTIGNLHTAGQFSYDKDDEYEVGRDYLTGWFSASFGAYRRFTGGDMEWSKFYQSNANPTVQAHLSLFKEGVALTKSLEWLDRLKFKSLEKDAEATETLEAFKKFLNLSHLLPNQVHLLDIKSTGILFQDPNNNEIDITELSDGYRSLLSLTLELLRLLTAKYGFQAVFKPVMEGNIHIPVSGVVLIDEVDAHLHPTWQTRIGQWFTQYFPNLQFIVATHSPLICRACEKGSIWQLTATKNGKTVQEITGTYRKRLIYGNILDAYGTEIFGETATISEETDKKLNRLTTLNQKSIQGETSEEEETELVELKSFLTAIH
jgi:energy-coupling factor transporter ATP-binding protein EcfA2